MELEAYWGVGPKTRATLEEAIGTEAALEAIEAGDVRALVEAGVGRSRATRILRRAQSADGMELLATRDARAVYKTVLEEAAEHAVSEVASDRIRTLTPLTDREAMADRLEAVERGRSAWEQADEAHREAILEAFEAYDDAGGGRIAAVEAAIELREAGVSGPVFEPIADLDVGALSEAAVALRALEGDRIAAGADGTLDRLREARETVDRLAASPEEILEELRGGGIDDTAGFRAGTVEYLRRETGLESGRIRDAMAEDAVDATAFVAETLRALREDLASAIDERREAVRSAFEADVDAAGADVERASAAIATVARDLSLGRFAAARDLTRPTYVDRGTLAVVSARNLSLDGDPDSDVQPVTYAVGRQTIAPPGDEQVSVLTGANSGGKTTLLETLCAVEIMAHMGLPVPAAEAEVSVLDRLVFHRRHASFNAGVLESTLRSVVPPLVSGDRTLMLVDEFEAITEPGRAADLLFGLVRLTIAEGALGTFVTHLADDLEPLPDTARTDGIFAEGLTGDLELEVDYQPRFGEVGRSTPEFIVSRLVANADERAEEAGFRTLAEALDTDVVQRTLSDAEWSGSETV
ncbi:MutS-related protein [Natronomonas sp.]|uniref:MutS-related protein n=1 Tax=Natronomonas sp. TaxID=2184060 RepID=UPI0026245332|nr:DNA mismatch repair protein [Natronomonas sp.]